MIVAYPALPPHEHLQHPPASQIEYDKPVMTKLAVGNASMSELNLAKRTGRKSHYRRRPPPARRTTCGIIAACYLQGCRRHEGRRCCSHPGRNSCMESVGTSFWLAV